MFVIGLLLSFIFFVLFHVDYEPSLPLIEGYTDPVPSCQTERVPSCYASLVGDDYLDFYSDAKREDYILKTEIVTPVCPRDPYASMGVDLKSADKMITDLSGNLKQDASNNWVFNNLYLAATQKPVDPLPANQVSKETQTDSKKDTPSASVTPAGVSSPSTVSDNYMLNAPKCKDEPKPNTCPPCPACERCPEPTVDCKRVVKYKDQQYPVPVISDFSHFSRY